MAVVGKVVAEGGDVDAHELELGGEVGVVHLARGVAIGLGLGERGFSGLEMNERRAGVRTRLKARMSAISTPGAMSPYV